VLDVTDMIIVIATFAIDLALSNYGRWVIFYLHNYYYKITIAIYT